MNFVLQNKKHANNSKSNNLNKQPNYKLKLIFLNKIKNQQLKDYKIYKMKM